MFPEYLVSKPDSHYHFIICGDVNQSHSQGLPCFLRNADHNPSVGTKATDPI